MSFPAIKDGDHPSGGGSTCSTARLRGFNSEILQCNNGIWYRLFLGDNIQLDFNPDRILLKHGDTLLEVKSDGVYVDGDLFVNGNLTVSEDVVVEKDITVGGNTTLDGDLLVGGDTTIEGDLTTDTIYVNSPRGVLNIGLTLSNLMG